MLQGLPTVTTGHKVDQFVRREPRQRRLGGRGTVDGRDYGGAAGLAGTLLRALDAYLEACATDCPYMRPGND